MKFSKIILLIALTFSISGCDDVFEYTVYGADVKNENLNTTSENLDLLKNISVNLDSYKLAFISDSHYFYNGLQTVIDDINKNEEIKFVIHGGDITEQGLLKEYEIFYDIMSSLKKPYLTVIGNHDYKSNGDLIYTRMFGSLNYSFEFNNNKFVLFDNIVWESEKAPDFDWLSAQLENNSLFNQVFVVAHIPPNSDQFTETMTQTYRDLMSDNNVPLSMHGHTHNYNYNQGEVSYLTVPALKKLAYCIITVKNENFSVELIEL